MKVTELIEKLQDIHREYEIDADVEIWGFYDDGERRRYGIAELLGSNKPSGETCYVLRIGRADPIPKCEFCKNDMYELCDVWRCNCDGMIAAIKARTLTL